MNALIVYMSHHGTTERVVTTLKRHFGYNNSTSLNLKNGFNADISIYDTIIIGGSIHAGKIQKGIRKFCAEYQEQLLTKKLGLFICHMDQDDPEKEFEDAFPEVLREHAEATGLFGGELLFEKMNFAEKFIIRRITGETKTVSRINHQAINQFIEEIAY